MELDGRLHVMRSLMQAVIANQDSRAKTRPLVDLCGLVYYWDNEMTQFEYIFEWKEALQ